MGMAAPPSPRGPGSSRVEMIVAAVVCVAAVCLVYAMLMAESAGIHHEIQLAAPDAARPGEVIALRAYVYATPDAPEGPTPIAPPVEVELRDGESVVGTVTLVEGAFSSLEGELTIPRDVTGQLTLEARAREHDTVVATVARAISIADDAPPAPALDRRAPTLAHFFLGPLMSDEPPPVPAPVEDPLAELGVPEEPLEPFSLDAIVPGGVCVPETECFLVVDVGALSVTPMLTDCVGVEPRPMAPVTGVATHHHALPLVVHGPEGTCDLVAMRGDVRLAHRAVRIPVALATPYLDVTTPVAAGRVAELRLVAPPGRDTVIVDVFRDGRWMRTSTFAASADVAAPTSVSLRDLEPGTYVLEARADALPTDYVFPRLFVSTASEVLTGRDAELTRVGAPRAEVLYRLAPREQHGLTLPLAASGLEADRMRIELQKRTARTVAFGGMALAIVLLVLAVFRRGLAADAEARAVMVAAGVPGADDRSARLRGTLNVVLMVLGLGLGLVVGAAFIAAHQIVIDAPNIAASPPIEPAPNPPSGPNAPGGSGVAPSPTAP